LPTLLFVTLSKKLIIGVLSYVIGVFDFIDINLALIANGSVVAHEKRIKGLGNKINLPTSSGEEVNPKGLNNGRD
jgi:hypothetical protein